MRGPRRPRALGLEIVVRHPESEREHLLRSDRPNYEQLFNLLYTPNQEGHCISYEMMPMPGEALTCVTIRRGMAPEFASALLRNLADLIDRHGRRLLNMPRGGEGQFTAEGAMMDDPNQLPRDEYGNLISRESLGPPGEPGSSIGPGPDQPEDDDASDEEKKGN
jgi:hypothetical protein